MNTELFEKYEVVVGLEVHAQLLTKTKAFSGDESVYGDAPNSHINPITLGHPGTLPVLNSAMVEMAIKMGIACGCEINPYNRFARKNYFYPDLPKGYQISQHTTPICTGGSILIDMENGEQKSIALTRIHMEEDAGKSIHDLDPYFTLIDLNRAGTPLIEIVSEPEIRSGQEAFLYLTEIRRLVRYLDICDGNMEEGSLRCDANISVRRKGRAELGQKVEVKNMNSIRNVKRAIEHEAERQILAIENGEPIHQETRTFDALEGKTYPMRSKEMAHDYRYFTEPDLPPLVVTETYREQVRASMPPLPRVLFRKFTTEYGLSEYDAGVLTDEKEIALWFENLTAKTKNFKAAANWVMGPVKSWLNETGKQITEFKISPEQLAALIGLIDSGMLNYSAAAQRVFPEMVLNPNEAPEQIAIRLNLIQQSDEGVIEEFVNQAIARFPEKVEEYRSGKKGLLGLFMGEVMKISKGKADPKLATRLLNEKLNQNA